MKTASAGSKPHFEHCGTPPSSLMTPRMCPIQSAGSMGSTWFSQQTLCSSFSLPSNTHRNSTVFVFGELTVCTSVTALPLLTSRSCSAFFVSGVVAISSELLFFFEICGSKTSKSSPSCLSDLLASLIRGLLKAGLSIPPSFSFDSDRTSWGLRVREGFRIKAR